VEDKNKVKKRRNNKLSVWCVKMKLKLVKIKKIERIPFKGYLYDITSLPYHNFLANDIIVHNCEGTLGRRIQKGWREIPVRTEDGKTISVEMKMNVQTIEGLSVSWDTPIMVKENGVIKILPIGSLIDKYLQSEGIVKVDGLEVPSFDENGKISFKSVKYLIKHKSNGKMLEIITKTGRRVKVSKGHSLFVLKDCSIKTMPSDKLVVGDYIIIPKRLPANPLMENLEIVKVDDLNLKEYKLLDGKISRKKGKMKYGPVNKCIDNLESFAKFVGYFLAEGDIDRNSNRIKLSFGAHEKNLIQDATNVIRNTFGVAPHFRSPYPSEVQVCVNSKLLVNFLENLGLYGNAHTKRVPFFVLNIPKETQLKCMESYINGDGYLDKSGNRKYIVGKSVNPYLLSDLAYILLQNDIIARIKGPYRERERCLNGKLLKESKVYKLMVLGDKIEKFRKKRISYPPFALPIKEIGLDKICDLIKEPKLKELAKSYIHNLRKGRKHIGIDIMEKIIEKIDKEKTNEEEKKIVNLIEKFVKGDITVDIIESIKEVEGSEFEYDISVEKNENFVGGIGGIMLHNSGHSDRNQLLAFIHKLSSKPDRVIIAHGESQKSLELARAIHKIFRVETNVPRNLESLRLK
jgi:intein/homing endonuclease